ncbi:hypothetical protein K0M31_002033 [Melipona bicolor]|uniref:Uncharacterized protein n=1 Tax=Melipona bicolor TaxID=60889 RepID=A0AA40GGT3_9HYME|nr:hypothetical protein K0M31_002033 [Melipona bicolor]
MTRVSSPPVAKRIYRSQDAALEGRRRVGFWEGASTSTSTYKDGTCGVLTSRLVPARVAAKTEQKRNEEKEHLKRRKEVDRKQDRNGRESEKGAGGEENRSNRVGGMRLAGWLGGLPKTDMDCRLFWTSGCGLAKG